MIDRICSLLKMKKPEMNRGLLFASGTAVPTGDGYQAGCVFQKTDGSVGTVFYVNEGSITSADFQAVAGLTVAQEALLGATPGVVTASKAVIVDANKDVGDYRNLDCVSLDAGSSGVAGSLDVFPATADNGKLVISCANVGASGRVGTLRLHSLTQTTLFHISDPGAKDEVYLVASSAALTPAEADVLDGALIGTVVASKAVVVDASKDVSSFRNVGMAGTLTVTGATGRAIDIVTSGVVRMGVQGTGIPVSTDYPVGLEVQVAASADVVPGATGLSAGVYSRYEVAADQTTQCNHVSVAGKLRVKKDLGDGAHAGVLGWVEISEAGTVIGGTATTTTAAGQFAVEADASFELSTGHLNGICVDSSVDSSATITGTMAGIRIKKSSGKKAWPVGIQIEGDAADQGIRVGNWVGSAATTGGLVFSTAMNLYADGQLDVVGAYGASSSDLGSGYSAKVGRFRHVVNSTACAQETYGLVGQVVVKDTTLSHLHAGLMGTFEGHTSGVVVNGAYAYSTAAILARIGGGAAITATKDVCGVIAFLNGAAMASGSCSAFAVGDQGTAAWTNALAVERATNLLKLPASGTDPVSVGGTVGTHGTATLKIAIKIGSDTYYLLASTVPTFT